MKAHILYNGERPDISELTDLFDIELQYTPHKIRTKYNPYFKEMWVDFDWLKTLFKKPAAIRCYATTKDIAKKAGVTKYFGMYNLYDRDGVLDFWVAVPKTLDKRAKKNGFKTNFGWLFVHEYLHGREQGMSDRVHLAEENGELKTLLNEYVAREKIITLQTVVISLLEKLIKILK